MSDSPADDDSQSLQLDEFIAETISQIFSGLSQARERTGYEAHIGVPLKSTSSKAASLPSDVVPMTSPQSHHANLAHLINFDVALTAVDTSSTKAGGKIAVLASALGAGASASKQDSIQSSSVTRVQFSIPISYPFDSEHFTKLERDRQEALVGTGYARRPAEGPLSRK